jgi:uncharacterized protein (TIGR02246 family)
MKTALPFVLAIALASCSGSAGSAREASVTMLELGQMNRDFVAALNAGDAAKAAALYAEDAVVIPPGEAMVRGRANIEAYWKSAIEAGAGNATVETIDAQSSGSLGYEIGSFTLTSKGPDGKPVKESGRYIELLKKGPDGRWYSTAGIWNEAPK